MEQLVCVQDFEDRALQLLAKGPFEYYRSGAGHEHSLREAREAYLRVKLKPRVLRDVSRLSVSTTVLGKAAALPLGLAPTAMQKLAHPEGEVASAKAALAKGAIFVLSTLSTSSIEEVGAATPGGRKWFQLFIYKDRYVTTQLVQRAQAAGFEALVLTVDRPVVGIRYADARSNFKVPPHIQLANFKGISKSDDASSEKGSEITDYVASLFDQTLTWGDVSWLKEITTLPIILKGILTAEDAQLAEEHGAAAIIVSNHGARQLDTVVAPLEVLPDVVKKLEGTSCEVYIDGGVTTGTDIFKALHWHWAPKWFLLEDQRFGALPAEARKESNAFWRFSRRKWKSPWHSVV